LAEDSGAGVSKAEFLKTGKAVSDPQGQTPNSLQAGSPNQPRGR